jgi:Holliday junction resolvasome RuvABC ATP-dependent DNA helicase subunit
MEALFEVKIKELAKKYAIEIFYYESLLKKLDEEMRVIKNGGEIEKTLNILAEKSVIIGNIDAIEKQIKPLKDEYSIAKEKRGYSSKELEKMLMKLSFLLEELITVQAANAQLLENNMNKTRIKINNVRKRVMLINTYKHPHAEGIYLQEER